METPIYKHDCDHCTFLGNYEYEGSMYDLYYCDQDGISTVIARFGTDGDYMSGMDFGLNHLCSEKKSKSPLATAIVRAYNKTLINLIVQPI